MNKSSLSDLRKILLELGLQEGDEVLVHADLRMLFKVAGGVEGILDMLREIVGDRGLLVTPSFTFSFPHQQFDVQKSVSNVGGMTTLFSRHSDVKRTLDGMTSYFFLGASGLKLIEGWDHSSYGVGSVVGQMEKNGAKVLQLGTDILSPIHYVEQLVGVPYRKLQRFEGRIFDGDKSFSSYTDFYCRTQDVTKIIPDPIRKEYYSTVASKAEFNKRICRSFRIDDFVSFARPRLEKSPTILIES